MCTKMYNLKFEFILAWNEKAIDIDCRQEDPIVSKKDRCSRSLQYLTNILSFI